MSKSKIKIKIKVEFIGYFSIAIFLLGISMLRPTLFGQTYTVIGLVLLLLAMLIVLIKNPSKQMLSINLRSGHALLSVMIAFFWIYCLFVALVIGDSNTAFLFKSVATGVFTAALFWFVFRDHDFYHIFFDWFAKLNSLLGWSIVITFILLFFVPFDSLKIGSVEITGYLDAEGAGDILFPFSPVYGFLSEYNINRFLGIYRESGIAQAFFCWSAIYLYFSNSKFYWVVGALAGALLCGSTTTFVSLFASSIIYFSFRKNIEFKYYLLIGVMLVCIILALLYLPGIGISDKSETHGASFDDRLFALSYAFDDTSSFIFGKGLYYAFTPYDGVGINAISFIYFIGFFGFLAYCLFFFILPIVGAGGLRLYFVLISPIFVTSLFFQPIVDAPLAYLVLYYIPSSKRNIKVE